jgi:prepilin signal peptidase PulO-like enzyme (type II secretory pathway)
MPLLMGALFFGLASLVGVLLADAVSKNYVADDNVRTFIPPPALVVAAGAVLGAAIVPHASSGERIVIMALACLSLSAIIMVDARFGIIPDLFTIVPLAIVLLLAISQRDWWVLVSTLVPAVPFALLALYSRGVGMGWGDVKLAALGGALLGAELSALTLALACLVAAAIARGLFRTGQAVPLGPYMAVAIAIALPAGAMQ